MAPLHDRRKQHHRELLAPARSLYDLIALLERRGERDDPAWQAKWYKAVTTYPKRFQKYVDQKDDRTLADIRPVRGQWYRLFKLDPSGHGNASKYLLAPDQDELPASFVGLNFEQVYEASHILVTCFGYGTEKLLPELDDVQSWSRIFDIAIKEVSAKVSGSTRHKTIQSLSEDRTSQSGSNPRAGLLCWSRRSPSNHP